MRRHVLAAIMVCAIGAAGPLLAQSPAPSPAAGPTFSKDVAPIFYKNCTSCHRQGEIGPMPLLTYQDARPWAKSIAAKVASGAMPPWHADPAYGEFLNDRRLSSADKEAILQWIANGAPEGNPADLPAPPKYAEGWQIGQPDAVFALREDYPVPAAGTIEYKYFEVPTNFTEDKWVQAFEVRPGDRSVVHHVIVFARAPAKPKPEGDQANAQNGGAQKPRRQGPFSFAPGMEEPKNDEVEAAKRAPANDRPAPKGIGSFVAAFAPGQAVRTYAEGTAIKIPAGATLVFQMHYTASGKATTDRSKIGVIFAKQPPRQEVVIAALQNANFTLPAGAPDVRVDAEMTLNQDMTIWSMLPHTHVRGKRWHLEATYPDGRTETILDVPRYDFTWQTDYVFKQPLHLPKGTKVRTSAWYDNSAANKSNPDPTLDVHWGDQTWQEMQFTAFAFTLDSPSASTVQER
jgi:mono/diheme cytochrome c family protein